MQGDGVADGRGLAQFAEVGHDAVAVDVGVDAVGGAAPLDLGDAAGERVGPVAEADQVRPDAEGGQGAGRGGFHGNTEGAVAEPDGPFPGDGDREQVGVADERGGELRTGPAVELLGGAAVLEPGAVHDGDPVGQGERLDLVVGDVQDRDVRQLAVQPGQFGEHPGAEAGVEGGERFVQEQHAGADGEGAGDRDALLLAAGEFAGVPVGVRGHADEFEGLGDPAGDLGLRGAVGLEPEGHVVLDLEVREEGVTLDDHADAAPVRGQGGDVPAAEEDPPGGGPDEPGDGTQRGGLAGSGGPEEGHHLAGFDGEVEPVEDDGPAVGDGDAVEADAAGGGGGRAHASARATGSGRSSASARAMRSGSSATDPRTWVAPCRASWSWPWAPVRTPATIPAPEHTPLSMS